MKRIAVIVALLLVAACGGSTTQTTATTSPSTTTTAAATTTTAPATTTTAATTTTTAPTTTTTEPAPVFAFLPTGLGVVDFGATPEEVMAVLNPLFGTPTKDTGWIDEPLCPPPLYRLIGYGPGLFDFTVIFTTAEYFAPAGTEQFFGYSYKGALDVGVTPPAVTVGTTLAQVQTLYPEIVVGPHPVLDGYQGIVTGDGNEKLDLALDAHGPNAVVTEIRGG
ncbi:MAG TPA: hypothetical protein VFY15_01870, partial [Acidimicrobiia bacterium]|nr:hypothetical protein [Acidimicrobiia bacterium]